MRKRHFAAVLMLALTAPAAAQTPVPLSRFDSVELRGGGRVVVRHGTEQRVTLIRGNLEMTRFSVDRGGSLEIDACVRTCRNYDLLVEIVTPDIEALAISGGGEIRTEAGFPRQSELSLAVSGGGELDASSIEAADVAAAVNGGGSIFTHARASLSTAVNGGGEVRYRGDPSISSAINGGGDVRPIRD